MKRTAIRRVRKMLRKNEPTSEEKRALRVLCCERALSQCEMPFPHNCPGHVPLELGHLAHLKAKRRFGWRESEATGQRHLWSCALAHRLQHERGWSGVKPCPAKVS